MIFMPVMNRVLCEALIMDYRTGNYLDLEAIPESIQEGYVAQFDSQEIRGRSTPYQGYASTGPRTVTATFMIYDDFSKKGIQEDVSFLTSLVYPEYAGQIVEPNLYLRVANIVLRGICNNVGVDWQKPIRNGRYIIASVNMSFVSTDRESPSAGKVEGGFFYAG